jgi:hypothetical protein
MAVDQFTIQHLDLLGFSIDRVPSCLVLKFWDVSPIEKAPGADNFCNKAQKYLRAKTIQTNHKNLSYIYLKNVFLGKGPCQSQIPKLLGHGS